MKKILTAGIIALLSACNVSTIEEIDQIKIENYIKENNLDAHPTGSGLYYVIDTVGTGHFVREKDSVDCNYTGYLTNDKVFDETGKDDTTNLYLPNTILGFQEGLTYFNQGAVGKLIIPSSLGYGHSSRENIPASSILIFDIKVFNSYNARAYPNEAN